MIKRTMLTGLLAAFSCLAATDAAGNDNLPIEQICTFTAGLSTCSSEFTLPGFKQADGTYGPWGYYIVLHPPEKYLGWLDWHVYVWTGREWENQGTLEYTPQNRSMTHVSSASKALRCRVTLKVVLGNPPAEADAVLVAATPNERADFVPLVTPGETKPILSGVVNLRIGGPRAWTMPRNMSLRRPTP